MNRVLILWLVHTVYHATPERGLERHPGDEDFLPANRAKQFELAGMLRVVGDGNHYETRETREKGIV